MNYFVSPHEAAAIGQIHSLTRQLRRWTAEINAEAVKFNPNQPRVPRGNSRGGEWTDTGGGSGGVGRVPPSARLPGGGRFGLGKIPKNPSVHDVVSRKPGQRGPNQPEDFFPGGAGGGAGIPRVMPRSPVANEAVRKIQKLNRQGADDLHDALTSRAQGRVSPKEVHPQVREAADDVEKFLGGKVKPEDIKPSKSGDLVILKGDKKFRMDVKNPGKLQDRRTSDDPHFHFQQLDENGDWMDASDQHRNYFKRD